MNEKSALVRVRMEYENGHVQELVGDEARKWLAAVNGCLMLWQNHGMQFPKFDWKIISPHEDNDE